MDYQKIMAEDKREYPEIYEIAITEIQEETIVHKMELDGCSMDMRDSLILKLKEKREFGVKKYEDNSFQNSFDNSMSTPTNLHAQEEIEDAMNYVAHEILKASFLNRWALPKYNSILENLTRIYLDLKELE